VPRASAAPGAGRGIELAAIAGAALATAVSATPASAGSTARPVGFRHLGLRVELTGVRQRKREQQRAQKQCFAIGHS
jgi:hypothetical protein